MSNSAAVTKPAAAAGNSANLTAISTAQLEKELLNNLLHADAFKLLPKLPAECVDLILTDIPFGLKYRSNRRKEKFNRVRNDDNLDWFPGFIEQAYRILRKDRFCFLFCNWKNYNNLAQIACKRFNPISLGQLHDGSLAGIVVWAKNNHGSGDLKHGLAPMHEFILCLRKGKPIWPTGRGRLRDVLNFPKVQGTVSVHPNQKLLELLRMIIEHATVGGEVVCDPFAGSFTTAQACIDLSIPGNDGEIRNFISCEIAREWFDRANLEPHDNQLELL